VCGRIKDVIIVGGRNVFPEDVERAVSQVEGVRPGNVIAFGVQGGRGKERIVVVAEARPDHDEDVRAVVAERVIDAVGLEASHGHGALHAFERAKQASRSETDRGHALRDAILACRPGGIVSVMGVYGGVTDKFPSGAFMNKGLTLKTGQCHVHRYLKPLYERIRNGDIDPSFVITHRLSLDEASNGYETFKHKQDDCVKVVLTP